jgi:hypothetical protein
MLTLGFNLIFIGLFAILTCVARKTYIASWFVTPFSTCICFFYLAYVDEQIPYLTRDFTMLVAVSTCYLLVALFNEAWIISVSFFAPLLGYHMWREGSEFLGMEFRDISLRALFVIICYAVTAWQLERGKKRYFLCSGGEDSFDQWTTVFNTFSEGIAIIKDSEITFKNTNFCEMFPINSYREVADPASILLKDRL